MRNLTILTLFCISNISWGQPVQTNNRFLTYTQNQTWLTTTKSLDKSGQWNAIKKRFFYKENQNTSVDSIQYSPVIIMNGTLLNIADKLTEKVYTEILNLLNEESIKQIEIIDKTPDNWIFHRPIFGAIILTVDKKTDKKIYKRKFG